MSLFWFLSFVTMTVLAFYALHLNDELLKANRELLDMLEEDYR